MDLASLAVDRCADVALPAFESTLLATGADGIWFSPCGHFVSAGESRRIYSPDLSSIVLETPSTAGLRFSPEGSRIVHAAERPDGTTSVQRMDLLTGDVWEKALSTPYAGPTSSPRTDFGFFLTGDGHVESWVCDAGRLSVFDDREAARDIAAFEVDVSSCELSYQPGSGFLFRLERASLWVMDLRGRRAYVLSLPRRGVFDPDDIVSVLDGEAVAPVFHTDAVVGDVLIEVPHFGPLFETRTGKKLAESWERVPMSDQKYAANQLDGSPALLRVAASGVVVVEEGLRGVYLFRDHTRALANRVNIRGEREIVYADFQAGSVELVSSGSTLTAKDNWTDRENGSALEGRVAASPLEKTVYFAAGDCGTAAADCAASSRLIRWSHDPVEPVEDFAFGRWAARFVGDGGAAWFAVDSEEYLLEPGHDTVALPFAVNAADWNGETTVFVEGATLERPTSRLAAFDPSTGRTRELATGAGSCLDMTSDLLRQRFAMRFCPAVEDEGAAPPSETWVGRFPRTAPQLAPPKE